MKQPTGSKKRWLSASCDSRSILILVGWTLVILLFSYQTSRQIDYFAQKIAITTATSNLQKDQAFRLWAASHGGVYVPVTPTTPINPYLKYLPARDITLPDGTHLTLMSPAYMSRQLNEQFHEKYGITGRLTSLKPLRPANRPDPWEEKALLSFEQGKKEVLEFTQINDAPYLRLMRPVLTTESCLKCHGHQGYKVGDVRGGVTIAQPITDILALKGKITLKQVALKVIIWFIGAILILKQGYKSIQSKRKTENALKQLQQERDIFMRGPVMTFTWKNDVHRTIEQVSSNAFDILGYSSNELLDGTISFSSLIHPDDLERVKTKLTRACTGKEQSFTHKPYRLMGKDGETIWIEDHTTLIYNDDNDISHFQGYLINISGSMAIAEELRDSKERLELVIQGANLGTWDWDIKKGTVLFNERWANMLGYSLAELKPHFSTWEERIHPDEIAKIKQMLTPHSHGQGPVYITEHRLKHKNSHWIWVLNVGRIFKRDEEGRPLHAVGIHLDITKQKEAEQALIKAKEIAESANRAKSSFLSNMSHELRTPLNAILGYTQLYLQDDSLSPKQKDGIKIIQESGEHLLQLINDILDLSKIEAGKIELVETEFQLEQFIQAIINIVQIRADAKGLTFTYQPGENLPTFIKTDALRLRQILLNLLDNGIKFTDHGHCTLKINALISPQHTLFTFTIEDSGAGIAADMQEHIFKPFQQTGERSRYAEGSGLGLAICRELLEQMNGTLQLTSPINPQPPPGEGVGSRFTVTLNFVTINKEETTAITKAQVTGYSTNNGDLKHILIVDDNESNRTVLRDTLTSLGFSTKEAEDGSEVLACCREFKPDLILMDLKMTTMDGFTATKQLKNHPDYKHIPVIAITASRCTKELNQRCLDHGFSDLITKPFYTVNLVESIATQLELDLQYKKSQPKPSQSAQIIPPPQPILDDLLLLIKAGAIHAIKAKVAEIRGLRSGRYHAFAQHIEDLAEDLQLIAIENFILKHQGNK